MKYKQLIFNDKAREKLLAGIDLLADAVITTLGPKGRNVAIGNDDKLPIITKDGVTVAKSINLRDPFEQIGAALVKEVANKTNNDAGDGTTTATVLTRSIFKNGLKYITSGANPIYVKRGIDIAVDAICKHLTKLAKNVTTKENIKNVATISANWDDSIGDIIANAMDKVGNDGVITVERSNTVETTLDVVEGMQINKGYLSPYFITNPQNLTVDYKNAKIIIYNKKLSTVNEFLPFLDKAIKIYPSSPFLLIADDVTGEASATLVVNKLRGNIDICAIKAPGFGSNRDEILEDIAILTGAKVISDKFGIKLDECIPADVLGTADVIVTKDSTTFKNGNFRKDILAARIANIKAKISESNSEYERNILQQRLAKLTSGIAIIKIGAPTEIEQTERIDRVKDALNATKAAISEGVVPGGGVALIRCAHVLDDIQTNNTDIEIGINIVKNAIKEPLHNIIANAGVENLYVLCIMRDVETNSGWTGYNVVTNTICDLFDAGVIDPKKVTRCALQNAASIAGLMLTTNCIITDDQQNQNNINDTNSQFSFDSNIN